MDLKSADHAPAESNPKIVGRRARDGRSLTLARPAAVRGFVPYCQVCLLPEPTTPLRTCACGDEWRVTGDSRGRRRVYAWRHRRYRSATWADQAWCLGWCAGMCTASRDAFDLPRRCRSGHDKDTTAAKVVRAQGGSDGHRTL